MAAISVAVVSPMNAIELIRYNARTQEVPMSMAEGIVCVGLFTASAGVVAVSTPMKAHNVNTAV